VNHAIKRYRMIVLSRMFLARESCDQTIRYRMIVLGRMFRARESCDQTICLSSFGLHSQPEPALAVAAMVA
jgi:hypothetical protein